MANIFLDMLQRKGSREMTAISYEKGFAKYYQHLKPKISELEEERLNALRMQLENSTPLFLYQFLYHFFLCGLFSEIY